jgi:hypothetical protein
MNVTGLHLKIASLFFVYILVFTSHSLFAQCSNIHVTTDTSWLFGCAAESGNVQIYIELQSNFSGTQLFDYTVKNTVNISGASNCSSPGSCITILQYPTLVDKFKFGSITYTITPYANGCAGTPKDITVPIYPWVHILTPPTLTVCDTGVPIDIPIDTDVQSTDMIFDISVRESSNVTPISFIGKSIKGSKLVDASSYGTLKLSITPYVTGNLNKCFGSTKLIDITILPRGTLTITSTSEDCPNSKTVNTTFSPVGSSQGTTYQLIKDGITQASGSYYYDGFFNNPSGAGPSFNITGWGSGEYYFVSTNQFGCTTTSAKQSITVDPLPQITAVPHGSTTFCQGGSIVLEGIINSASPSKSYSYQWYKGGALLTGKTQQTLSVTESGSYHVSIYYLPGCSVNSEAIGVTVVSLPTATITSSGGSSICTTGVTLTSNGSPGGYLWSTGETTQSITTSRGGGYWVRTINAQGCQATSSVFNIADNRPSITILPNSVLSSCSSSTSATLVSSYGASYLWYPTGETTQSINVSNAGNYYVKVNDPPGCPGSSLFSNPVKIESEFSVTITGKTTFCAGNHAELYAYTPGVLCHYLWSDGTTTASNWPTSPGTYTVTATSIYTGCSITSAPVTVTMLQNTGGGFISSSATCYNNDPVTLTANPSGSSYIWSNGSSSRSISAAPEGNYFVTVHGTFGSTHTACYDLYPCFYVLRSAEDTEDKITSAEVSVQYFPNPADRELLIKLGKPAEMDSRLELLDVSGRKTLTDNIPQGELEKVISTRELTAGTYLLHLHLSDQLHVQKIVIIHEK